MDLPLARREGVGGSACKCLAESTRRDKRAVRPLLLQAGTSRVASEMGLFLLLYPTSCPVRFLPVKVRFRSRGAAQKERCGNKQKGERDRREIIFM
jgi:hypothetical protein